MLCRSSVRSRATPERYSTAALDLNTKALDTWIASPKTLVLADTFNSGHLADLFITLPTRDGTRRPVEPSSLAAGAPLAAGHHLAFFHPRHPDAALRPDGTDADFCPPPPFTRRMWAGGRMRWSSRTPLRVGARATAVSDVAEVQKKGFDDRRNPMVFVKQRVGVQMEGAKEESVVEERSHVYLPVGPNVPRRQNREVPGLPKPDFSLTYTPTLTTLFRFSALTFNGHHIHLDKDYAQSVEGYPERLVHGPLTALMLLETVLFYKPNAQLTSLEYRARNPVIVNRPSTIKGSWENEKRVQVWAEDSEGVVGMTGAIECL